MKRLIDVLKAVCSIGAALVIYMTVMKIVDGDENMLLYILASVFAAALALSLYFAASLGARVSSLERTVRALTDDSYEQETPPAKECPICHSFIDADEEVCPYCKGERPFASGEGEAFATDDPDYKGTDHSGEEYVSAYVSDDAE